MSVCALAAASVQSVPGVVETGESLATADGLVTDSLTPSLLVSATDGLLHGGDRRCVFLLAAAQITVSEPAQALSIKPQAARAAFGRAAPVAGRAPPAHRRARELAAPLVPALPVAERAAASAAVAALALALALAARAAREQRLGHARLGRRGRR